MDRGGELGRRRSLNKKQGSLNKESETRLSDKLVFDSPGNKLLKSDALLDNTDENIDILNLF